jgi:hypothetical protein
MALAASRTSMSLQFAQPISFTNFSSAVSVLLPINTVAPLSESTSSNVVELIAIEALSSAELD